jgi:hypothetical protein
MTGSSRFDTSSPLNFRRRKSTNSTHLLAYMHLQQKSTESASSTFEVLSLAFMHQLACLPFASIAGVSRLYYDLTLLCLYLPSSNSGTPLEHVGVSHHHRFPGGRRQ